MLEMHVSQAASSSICNTVIHSPVLSLYRRGSVTKAFRKEQGATRWWFLLAFVVIPWPSNKQLPPSMLDIKLHIQQDTFTSIEGTILIKRGQRGILDLLRDAP